MTRRRPAADGAPCPTCRGPVPPDGSDRPFCSQRCRMVDLGRWFTGEYVIPGEPAISFDDIDPAEVAMPPRREGDAGGGDADDA